MMQLNKPYYLKIYLLSVISFLITGCGHANKKITYPVYAPVIEGSANQSHPVVVRKSKPITHTTHRKRQPVNNQSYTVMKGDTLYSVAWRYHCDFRELANKNHIRKPYAIYPGQILQLTATATVTNHHQTNEQTSTHYSNANNKLMTWHWPAKAKLVQAFSAANKGIDLSAALGQPIHAANTGQVVYSGSGLRGYGQLIILKHSDDYLSAYAHNDKLLVKEGDWVKAGQVIATMGHSGTTNIHLHFEIRRAGVPVDPLKYLAPAKAQPRINSYVG